MQKPNEPGDVRLKSILYISIPDKFAGDIGGFVIDPSIMLPVDSGSEAEQWNLQDLNWEMIVSGMLKVLAFDPSHEDNDYYREFVKALKPNLSNELTEAAIVKARNRDYDLAEEIFLALLGLEPANSRFLINLALLYEDRSRNYQNLGNEEQSKHFEDKALTWYNRALLLDEPHFEAHLYSAHFFLRQHNYSRAQIEFENALDKTDDPEQRQEIVKIVEELNKQDDRDSLFKQAYSLIREGKESEGIAKIRIFLKDHQGVWNAWFLLGWGLRRAGSWSEAKLAFLKAHELGGKNADSLNELSICEMEEKNFDNAKSFLEEALRLEPENLKVISNLGILELKQGNKEKARQFFALVLDLEPEDLIAQQYLELLAD